MKTIAAILSCGVLAGWAGAQEVDVDTQYFHPAASRFIQGDTLGASNLVARGLSEFPRNAKLKRLKELLEQQEQQQDQNQEQNQGQDENEQEENQEQNKNEDENREQEQSSEQEPEPSEEEPRPEEPQQSEPEPAEQMTEDEAKQLLDAMRQEEKNKRLRLHPVMGAPVKVDKDW